MYKKELFEVKKEMKKNKEHKIRPFLR